MYHFIEDLEQTTISRAPRDKEHPFLMVSKELIRDESLSIECRWLIIYLLTNTDDWVISTKQVYNHAHQFIGRDKVRELFNEAIKAGYMKREEYREDGLQRYKYLISESPQFLQSETSELKKILPGPGF